MPVRRRPRRFWRLNALMPALLIVGAVALLSANCSGPAPEALPHYTVSADKICQDVERAVQERINGPPAALDEVDSSRLLAAAHEIVVEELGRQFAEMRRLNPPESEVAAMREYLRSFEAALDDFSQAGPVALSGQPETLADTNDPFAAAVEAGRGLGFRTCG